MTPLSQTYSEPREILVETPRRRGGRLTHQLTHPTHERGAADLARAKRCEVRGRHLAVDHFKAPSRELTRQEHQRDLRRITAASEHRFAKEHPPERNAIQAADEHVIRPGFNRV